LKKKEFFKQKSPRL